MTATVTSISTRTAQPRLRLTRRGRAVLTTLAATPLVIIALIVALNGGGAVATSQGSSVPLEQVTISAGQTLYDLAEEYAPDSDPSEFVSDIVALNDLGGSLQPGQSIDIPAEYTTE